MYPPSRYTYVRNVSIYVCICTDPIRGYLKGTSFPQSLLRASDLGLLQKGFRGLVAYGFRDSGV